MGIFEDCFSVECHLCHRTLFMLVVLEESDVDGADYWHLVAPFLCFVKLFFFFSYVS